MSWRTACCGCSASVGIVASQRVGRAAKSTKDTHWIRISGADQVERAIRLVPERDRPGVLASIARQHKRIAPTGYRRFGDGPAWVRVTTSERERTPVRSIAGGPVCAHGRRQWRSHVVELLSQGCRRAEAARGQLRLSLPAADGGDRGQRAAEAARDRQAAEAPRRARRQARRAAGAGVQAEHRRHARGLLAGALRAAAGRRRRRHAPATRSPRSRRASWCSGVDFADSPLEAVADADAVVLVTEWPEFIELDWGEVARRCAGTLVIDGRNALDADAVRGAGLLYEGIGRGDGLMQAVILVGGEGTRLRPLTSTVPKPVVPLVDRPFIAFMLEWLQGHGVDDVIMSCGFLATSVRNVLGDGSALRNQAALRRGARPARHRRRAEVRRVDARRALPDAQRRRAHRHRPDRADRPARAHRREGHARARRPSPTRARTGWCTCNEDRSVADFVEKPSSDRIDTNLISAGAYVLEREILELVPADRNVSIEREVWPALIGDGLYGFPADAYWLDIGTPERYLQGTFDIIEGNVDTAVRARLGESWLAVARGRRGARPGDPSGGDRARRARRAGRARRQPGRARRERAHRPRQHGRALGDPQRRGDRRGLHAARLHRRGRLSRRRRHPRSRAGRCSARA